MANQQFGEVGYSDEGNQGKRENNKDLWLRLQKGNENYLRLLTNPFQYTLHKIKKDPNNKKDFGQKVGCSALHGSCPACDYVAKQLESGAISDIEAKAQGPKMRWLFGCIDRNTSTYKILDVSWAVFSQIKAYANNIKIWGDPTRYDINICVNPNGGATGYYILQPGGSVSKVLSAEDQAIKDQFLDLDDLKRRSSPPAIESVQKRLNYILGDNDRATQQTSAKVTGQVVKPQLAAQPQARKPAPKSPVVVPDEEDEDFPNYDADNN